MGTLSDNFNIRPNSVIKLLACSEDDRYGPVGHCLLSYATDDEHRDIREKLNRIIDKYGVAEDAGERYQFKLKVDEKIIPLSPVVTGTDCVPEANCPAELTSLLGDLRNLGVLTTGRQEASQSTREVTMAGIAKTIAGLKLS